jgi:hypothetical protein
MRRDSMTVLSITGPNGHDVRVNAPIQLGRDRWLYLLVATAAHIRMWRHHVAQTVGAMTDAAIKGGWSPRIGP